MVLPSVNTDFTSKTALFSVSGLHIAVCHLLIRFVEGHLSCLQACMMGIDRMEMKSPSFYRVLTPEDSSLCRLLDFQILCYLNPFECASYCSMSCIVSWHQSWGEVLIRQHLLETSAHPWQL